MQIFSENQHNNAKLVSSQNDCVYIRIQRFLYDNTTANINHIPDPVRENYCNNFQFRFVLPKL